MGNSKSTTTTTTTATTTTNNTTIDSVYDTAGSSTYIENFLTETGRIYFGNAIENDPSLRQIQQDLLSFDNTIDNTIDRFLFRRKSSKQPENDLTSNEDYNQNQQIIDDQNYIQSRNINDNTSSSITDSTNSIVLNNNKSIWKCSYCFTENKMTELACRRCLQAETAL